MAGAEVKRVVPIEASASVVGKRLGYKLGIWKSARKDKVGQGDASFLEGNVVVNTTCKVMDSAAVLAKVAKNTKVLDIGNGDVIWGLAWLMENRFSMDTQNRCQRNVVNTQVRDLRYNSGNLNPEYIISHMLIKWTNH